jgi:hypothetical protein
MANPRRMPTPASYHLLPIAEKRAQAIASVREPAVTCPICDTQVMPVDLLAHMDLRCPGPRTPGPGAKWISRAEALAMGISSQTFKRWVERGFVRSTGQRKLRKYLHRDLAVKIAQRRGFKRRSGGQP